MTLLGRYCEVTALPGERFGATDKTEHHIKLKPGIQPIYIPAYRLPHCQRQIVDEQIKDMLEQGVIQHSASLWNSLLFLVPKKDGQYRPVIDFRRANEVTEDDRYPLPILKDLLMSLGQGNKIFSSLHLLSGYWQVPMAPKSREIIAFSTPTGHHEFRRMSFRLKSASNISKDDKHIVFRYAWESCIRLSRRCDNMQQRPGVSFCYVRRSTL